MPKMKTRKSAAKRFRVTGTGKVAYKKMGLRHILTKKSSKRKMNLRHANQTQGQKEEDSRPGQGLLGSQKHKLPRCKGRCRKGWTVRLPWKKGEEEGLQEALDRTYQRCGAGRGSQLLPVHARPEARQHRAQQEGAVQHGHRGQGCIQRSCRSGQDGAGVTQDHTLREVGHVID